MYGELHLREGRLEFRWKRWRNKKRQEVSSCLMVLLSGAIPPPPSRITPLSSTIRQLDTSWRFLFRHRRQRNSTLPSCRWKLPVMACPHLGRHCRSYTRLDEPII